MLKKETLLSQKKNNLLVKNTLTMFNYLLDSLEPRHCTSNVILECVMEDVR